MIISEEKKKKYIDKVYDEMKRRGFTADEIPIVISKTGFMIAIEEYPEEQMHYDIADTVDEILFTATKHKKSCNPRIKMVADAQTSKKCLCV